MVGQVKEQFGADVEWMPFLLRPDMPEEGMEVPAHIRAKRKQGDDRLQNMAQTQGLPWVPSDWMPNPRLAHETTAYAAAQGRGESFHRIVFRLYYGEGQDIGKWEALRAAAVESGLDPEAMQRAVTGGEYRQIVDEQIETAYSIGVNSVPTYVLNDRYSVVGAQPFAVFKQVIQRINAQQDQNSNQETDE